MLLDRNAENIVTENSVNNNNNTNSNPINTVLRDACIENGESIENETLTRDGGRV